MHKNLKTHDIFVHTEQNNTELLFLIWQPSYLGIVRPIDEAPICLSEEEVIVHAGLEVLLEVDNSLLIDGNPWGILGHHLRPHPILLLNLLLLIVVGALTEGESRVGLTSSIRYFVQ